MRTPRIADPRVCSINEAISILGAKWTLLVLREILLDQCRFDQIVYNTGAPRDVLVTRLKELEAAGLVVRARYSEKPARFEYRPSDAASALFAVLNCLREWGDSYARDDPENIVTVNHSCGAPLRSVLVCGHCREPVEPPDVHYSRLLRRSQVETQGDLTGR